jgi:hypothetical protein
MDKQQQQDLAEVLKKHHRSTLDNVAGYLKKVRTGVILGVGLDLIFTAGFGTVTAVTAAALPGLRAAFRKVAKSNRVWRGPEKQAIEAGPDVMMTLAEIEARLSWIFTAAVKPLPGKPAGRDLAEAETAIRHFRKAAEEAQQDVAKLLPAITITSGGAKGYGTDKFVMVIADLNDAVSKAGDTRSPTLKLDYMSIDEAFARADARQAQIGAIREEWRRQAEEAAKPPPVIRPRGFNL